MKYFFFHAFVQCKSNYFRCILAKYNFLCSYTEVQTIRTHQFNSLLFFVVRKNFCTPHALWLEKRLNNVFLDWPLKWYSWVSAMKFLCMVTPSSVLFHIRRIKQVIANFGSIFYFIGAYSITWLCICCCSFSGTCRRLTAPRMPRYDDRYGGTRLYVGHLSSRTRSRDLEDLFSRYGRYHSCYPICFVLFVRIWF